jgi:hypothetical protein
MKPLVLFIVGGDPRTSGHPVEAIRMAVGVGTWQRVDVAVYLSGPAVLVAAEDTDDIVDAENLDRYTPLLREMGRPLYIDAAFQPGLTDASVPIETLDARGLAALAARSAYVLRF